MTPLTDNTTPDLAAVKSLAIPSDGWIRRYVDTYSGQMEVPDEALAGSAYALLSSAVGWKSYLNWSDGSEPLTLYVALIGASATAHKTTSLNIAERIARDANTEYRRLTGISDTDTARIVNVFHGGHLSQAKLLDILGPSSQDQADEWARPGRIPPCNLCVWDELQDLLVQERGKSFLAETRQMLLRIYGGNQPGSQTRANFVAPSRCSLAVIGTVTLDTWRNGLGAEAVSSGLMGRLLAIPYGAPPHWVPLPTPVDHHARQALVSWLVELGRVPSSDWGPVTLSPDALDYWDHWYRGHKDQIAKEEHTDPQRASAHAALFGRYQATALKFAGIQAISRWEPGTSGVPKPYVDARTLDSACRYIDHVMSFSVPVATEALEDFEYKHMRRLVEHVESKGTQKLADAHRVVRTRGVSAERARRLAELLHDEGKISLERREDGLWIHRPEEVAA